jgi:5-methylcytosine-specific restriction endonuclease McrA
LSLCRDCNSPAVPGEKYCAMHLAHTDQRRKVVHTPRQPTTPFKGAQRPNETHYHTSKHRAWSAAIIARDKVCLVCGSTDNLQADHIKPLELCEPGERYSLDNGQALCRHCHAQKTALESLGRRERKH